VNPAASEQPTSLPGSLVLIGPMGSGKSSVARHLASLTGHRFSDTDRLIVMQSGLKIPQIFEERGEAEFRRLEREALLSVKGWSRLVVATGGGIVELPENIETLRAMGCVIWLTARPEILWRRVSADVNRPLLKTMDPRATLQALVDRRAPHYAAAAHVIVDTSEIGSKEVAERALEEAKMSFATRAPTGGS
jgi:shikimate kinase